MLDRANGDARSRSPSAMAPTRGVVGPDETAVEKCEEAIAAIPPDENRHGPARAAGVTIGQRAHLLGDELQKLLSAAKANATKKHHQTVEDGYNWGLKNPLSSGRRCAGATTSAKRNSPARNGNSTPKKSSNTAAMARRHLTAAKPIEGTVGELYLTQARSICSLPSDHGLGFVADNRGGTIVAPFKVPATGVAIDAVQVTFVAGDGSKDKNRGKNGRLSYGSRGETGAGIVMGDVRGSKIVVVGEGIETVLSAMKAYGTPGVAASGCNYGNLLLPHSIETIVVAADHKGSDAVAKQTDKLRQRFPQAVVAVVRTPDSKLDDLNDYHREHGLDALRELMDQAVANAERVADVNVASSLSESLGPPPLWAKGDGAKQSNIRNFLDWRGGGSLTWNDFSQRAEISLDGYPVEVDERVCVRLRLEADELGLRSARDFFDDVLFDHARRNQHHPVRDYLDGLTWDGTPRIDHLLSTYLGAAETTLHQAFAELFMLAAVRRVRRPGVKFDTMLVLEGAQGGGKSSALSILGGAWFSDALPLTASAQQVIELTAKAWIVEVAELKGMRAAEVEGMKAMLSRSVDRARLSYARQPVDVPRQFILAGTVNDRQYLTDTTGNRRFWPVRCGKIDLEALRRDRDQLWAEAAAREKRCLSITLAEELWPAAAEAQADREHVDPFGEKLAEALCDQEGFVTIEAVWQYLGYLSADRRNGPLGQRISASLTRLGFTTRKKRRLEGRLQSIYCTDGNPEKCLNDLLRNRVLSIQ